MVACRKGAIHPITRSPRRRSQVQPAMARRANPFNKPAEPMRAYPFAAARLLTPRGLDVRAMTIAAITLQIALAKIGTR